MQQADELRLAIDIGGTFTDTVLMDGDANVLATTKTPTTPENPALGARTGTQTVLQHADRSWQSVTGFIHGTTLATNALIERRGAKVATITTKGFRDILEIGYERRYSQYAINIEKPNLIVERAYAYTIGGRMDVSGEEIEPLDTQDVENLVPVLRQANIKAVAVCFLHAYANPAHELEVRNLLIAEMPELVVSLSHEVSPEAREFDRLCTTVANAYIQPLMSSYLAEFQKIFAAEGISCPILMMTAGGGMTTLETAARLPIRLVESGPAGGAVLAARIAEEANERDVLSFDIGGTTAKLCLIDNFRPQTARRFEIARAERFIRGSGMPVRIPVIEMIEIGAGGGSIAHVDRLGRLSVGPESAGSVPGPAAFGKGGENATVTDADVVLGLIDPERFAEGRLSIDVQAARSAVAEQIGAHLQEDTDSAALGISEIVDESMASAGRMHAVESGKDIETRLMIAFGGNGPLHATRVARRAGVRRILVPRDPGVGSAIGFLYAPVSFEIVRSNYTTLAALDIDQLNHFLSDLLREATAVVRSGAPQGALSRRHTAFMRYRGQGHEIEVDLPDRPLTKADIPDLQTAFEAAYSAQFSRSVPGMTIEVLNWAVSVASKAAPRSRPVKQAEANTTVSTWSRSVFCDVTGTCRSASVFDRLALAPGDCITGPALITEPQTTTFVSADFSAQIDARGNIWLTRLEEDQA